METLMTSNPKSISNRSYISSCTSFTCKGGVTWLVWGICGRRSFLPGFLVTYNHLFRFKSSGPAFFIWHGWESTPPIGIDRYTYTIPTVMIEKYYMHRLSWTCRKYLLAPLSPAGGVVWLLDASAECGNAPLWVQSAHESSEISVSVAARKIVRYGSCRTIDPL